jgi:hypothetical protein
MQAINSANIIPEFKELARKVLGLPVNCNPEQAQMILILADSYKQVFQQGLTAGKIGALIPSLN